MHDIVDLLANPTDEMVRRSVEDRPRDLARSIADLRHGLGKLLDGPLRGMFDGPSTVSLDWSGRGIVIDLSAVHQDPDAMTVVMIAATGWLQALLAAPEGEDKTHHYLWRFWRRLRPPEEKQILIFDRSWYFETQLAWYSSIDRATVSEFQAPFLRDEP